MARDVKIGIDYFSHDTDMFHDPKIRILKAKYGLIGYAVYIRLLEEIYHNNGYYIELDEDYMLLFADENNITINELENIIDVCINKELFDINKYNDYNILTSKRIQKNYLDATARRKNCEISSEHDLVNVDINAINVDINATKKSKVNNIKVNIKENIKEKKPTPRFVKPTIDEIAEYCIERKNNLNPNQFYDFYEAKSWMIGKNKMKDWKAAVRTWERRNQPKSQTQRDTSHL